VLGHGGCPVESFKLPGQQQRRPDDKRYSAGNVVESDRVALLIVNGADRQYPQLNYITLSGKLEPYSVNSDALWRPAWTEYALERHSCSRDEKLRPQWYLTFKIIIIIIIVIVTQLVTHVKSFTKW